MLMNKKFYVVLFLAVTVALSIAASAPPQGEPKRNLKVLPKNISHEDLDKVMHGFNDALGVKCNHCHSGGQVDGRFKMDFASDAKPEKEMARNMLRMTAKINKKFFHFKAGAADAVPPISCMTCHNGKVHPEGGKK